MQPESSQGLKKFSTKFLNDVLKLNLKTPPDVVLGIIDLEGLGAFQAYEESIGKEAIIDDYRVKNPGTISSVSDAIRTAMFNRNRPINQADFSNLDGNSDSLGYTYYSLSDDIGKLVQLSDYTVPSLTSITSQFNLSTNEFVKINMLNNKFVPNELEVYDNIQNTSNTTQKSYINNDGTLNGSLNIIDYTPSNILSINVSKSYNYNDDPVAYLKYNGNVLQNETLLMNIAAIELNKSFNDRINQAKLLDNSFTADIKASMGDPASAINILKDPINNLISKNYNITVPQNPLSNAVQLTNSFLGISNITDLFTKKDHPLTPTCFNKTSQGYQQAIL